MSKPFWLPTQKGTLLFPDTVKAPIKLVVKGVPAGSPLERQLVAAHEGALRQFLSRQRQAYSLSTVPIQHNHIDLGDIRLTYTNNHGQETVSIEVRPRTSGGGSIPRVKRYRDMLLLTFKYPEMLGRTATHTAYLTIPQLAPLPATNAFPVRGVAFEDSHYANDQSEWPVLSFPAYFGGPLSQTPFATRAPDGFWYSTLLVDLRPLTGIPSFTIDIHCLLGGEGSRSCDHTYWAINLPSDVVENTVQVPPYDWYTLQSASGGAVTFPDDHYVPLDAYTDNWFGKESEIAPPLGYEPTVYDPPGLSDTMLVTDPAIPPGWDTTRTITQGNYYSDAIGTADFSVPSGSGATGHYTHWQIKHFTRVQTDTWRPGYQWVTRPDYTNSCEVFGTFLSPADELGISHTTGSQDLPGSGECPSYSLSSEFYSWELRASYPDRPIHQRLGEAVATSTPTDGANTFADHFRMPRLCQITYDREHDALSMKV